MAPATGGTDSTSVPERMARGGPVPRLPWIDKPKNAAAKTSETDLPTPGEKPCPEVLRQRCCTLSGANFTPRTSDRDTPRVPIESIQLGRPPRSEFRNMSPLF